MGRRHQSLHSQLLNRPRDYIPSEVLVDDMGLGLDDVLASSPAVGMMCSKCDVHNESELPHLSPT